MNPEKTDRDSQGKNEKPFSEKADGNFRLKKFLAEKPDFLIIGLCSKST
jgi:hypothetical protein